VHPRENANTVAVEQMKRLAYHLPADGGLPLFVFDAGYDFAQLTQDLDKLPVAILVRLRADRCFYADPPPAVPSPRGGRPRQHGAKFACQDATTWPVPTAEHIVDVEYCPPQL
jgi:DDE superfamily endonuclease